MEDRVQLAEEELQRLRKAHPDSTELIDGLIALAWELALKDPPRSHALTDEAQALAERLEYESGLAYCKRNNGYFAGMRGDYQTSLELSQAAMDYFWSNNDLTGQSTVQDTLSWVFWRFGHYDKAVQCSYDSLNLNRKIGDLRGEAWALHNIANLNKEIGDLDTAIEYYQQAFEKFQEAGYVVGQGRIMAALGYLYRDQGDLDKALGMQLKSLEMAREHQVAIAEASSLTAVGKIYKDLGKLDLAAQYYEECIEVAERTEHRDIASSNYLNLGELYRAKGDLDTALDYMQKSLDLARETAAKLTLSRIHHAIALVYEQQSKPAESLQHYKRFSELKDEVFSEENKSAIKNLEIRLQIEKAEQEAEIHRLKYVELAQMQAQLIQSEKLALLGNLVAGIAHEVNTPVGIINSNMDVARRAIDKIVKEAGTPNGAEVKNGGGKIFKALDILKTNNENTAAAAGKIAGLIQNLKNFARLDQADQQLADVHDGIRETLALLKSRLHEGITINCQFGEVPQIRCFPQQLNQVFMTLLMNAADAIDETGEITVKTAIQQQALLIDIADSGRGIPADKLGSIFEIGFASKDEKVRMNVGLATAYNIIQNHSGEIDVTSQPGSGTTFTIKLPLS